MSIQVTVLYEILSSFQIPNYTYVNDVLIDMYGRIHPTWDFSPEENWDFVMWLKTYKEHYIED